MENKKAQAFNNCKKGPRVHFHVTSNDKHHNNAHSKKDSRRQFNPTRVDIK